MVGEGSPCLRDVEKDLIFKDRTNKYGCLQPPVILTCQYQCCVSHYISMFLFLININSIISLVKKNQKTPRGLYRLPATQALLYKYFSLNKEFEQSIREFRFVILDNYLVWGFFLLVFKFEMVYFNWQMSQGRSQHLFMKLEKPNMDIYLTFILEGNSGNM